MWSGQNANGNLLEESSPCTFDRNSLLQRSTQKGYRLYNRVHGHYFRRLSASDKHVFTSWPRAERFRAALRFADSLHEAKSAAATASTPTQDGPLEIVSDEDASLR